MKRGKGRSVRKSLADLSAHFVALFLDFGSAAVTPSLSAAQQKAGSVDTLKIYILSLSDWYSVVDTADDRSSMPQPR